MTRSRFLLLPLALFALSVGPACSADETGSTFNITEGDDVGGLGEAGDADYRGDADSTDIPDVAEPGGDVVDPGEQVDPSQWDDFDLGENEPIEGADLIIGPAERPARVLLPNDYDGSRPLPVIFLFHGFTATSGIQDAYMGLSPHRHDRDFIIVLPDGLTNATGQQYWNATDFCCDLYGDEPDDVAYFEELLDELLDEVEVDPARVHLMGHSNGHFFSNRLACDMGSRLASFVGLGGGGFWDESDCQEDGSVSVLHIHGTSDAIIYYAGAFGLYPGAQTMAERWALRNDCSDTSSIYGYISLAALIWGRETVQRRYADCPQGIDVELWSIVGGSHMPVFEADFAERILDFALPRTNPDAL